MISRIDVRLYVDHDEEITKSMLIDACHEKLPATTLVQLLRHGAVIDDITVESVVRVP